MLMCSEYYLKIQTGTDNKKLNLKNNVIQNHLCSQFPNIPNLFSFFFIFKMIIVFWFKKTFIFVCFCSRIQMKCHIIFELIFYRARLFCCFLLNIFEIYFLSLLATKSLRIFETFLGIALCRFLLLSVKDIKN